MDSEHDTPTQNPAPAAQFSDAGEPAAPAPRRRRRAASRPAGPPAPVHDPLPVAESAAEEAPASEPVADEPPVSESPTADEPTADEPTAEEPAAEEPAAEEPAADEPAADEPAADEDAAEEPAAEEPAAEELPGEVTTMQEPPVDVPAEAADHIAPVAAAVEEAADQDTTNDQDGSADQGDTTDQDESDDDDDSDETSGGEGSSSRRRRRRRGGRRRRRADDGDDATDGPSDEAADPDQTPTAENSEPATDQQDQSGEDPEDASESGGDSSGRRRRRRRRRRGEDSGNSTDDPAVEVVERVREPRSRKKVASEITGIDGSTRMEAKRQRRREGREAGRRRAPILSEAEFLARREAVNRKMVIRQTDDLAQIAVLEDGVLVEHYVDRDSAASLIGNVYLGRVQNVLPSMEAAFIDIGRGRNAVLYAGEIAWEGFDVDKNDRKVEKVLKSGQTIMVQVSKDPVGAKGARLINHVTLPGRYIVYSPDGHLSGISRKLPDIERKRLREVLNGLVTEPASVVVRTAAEGASEEELVRDVNRLKAQWEDIERKVKAGQAPQLLYSEPDLTLRIVRDLFTEDFSELVIQGNGENGDTWDAVSAYVGHVAPHLQERLVRWDADEQGDLFAHHRLDEQIAKGLERKVFLPSGGSLIIDRTEAMTVIDVNTGKFTGSGGNLEATITSNNLEAAEEIVRQLRLRDIGGIIVIDFIDMVLPANRELLLRRLVECLGRDRTRHQVAEVTSLGLVQMTRKKIGTGLLEAFSEPCPHCHGRGVELFDMPVETQKQADGGARETGHSTGGSERRGRGGRTPRKDTSKDVGNETGKDGNGSGPGHVPSPADVARDHQPEPAEAS